MADTTNNLDMPFILPSQAQKHVTHNEALLKLDALVHLSILDQLDAPPVAPAEGDNYLVSETPTGAWTGKPGRIASWQDGHWSFAQPREGWRAWFAQSEKLKVFNGTGWQDIPMASEGSVERIGVGTVPDSTNRLAIASPASLFTHAGSDHRIKVNKSAGGDTASLLFQTNWTGHAEMGLAGSNDFAIKVSDGATWKTGLIVASAGHVVQPNQPAARAYRTGTSFSPTAGQQSGFTTFAIQQGGVAFGAAAAGGGNRIIVPAAGLYLVALNVAVQSSSGHTTTLFLNGIQPLFSIDGTSGGAQMQSSTGIYTFSAGDYLTLGHAGTAQLLLGASRTEISLTML